MPNKISRVDITDLDLVDQVELRSDGTTTIIAGVAVVSTTTGTRDVVLSGIDLEDSVNSDDEWVTPGDKVTLSGTTGGADGDYTVELILGPTSFRVVEAIASSTGGTAEFIHPVGAGLVGFDATGLTQTSADNVQDAIEDIDSAVNGHRSLDELVHLVAEDSYEEYIYTGTRVDQIIVWTNSGKTTKIREEIFTYTANKLTTLVIKQYNAGGTLVETLTETYNYTGNKLDDIDRVLT